MMPRLWREEQWKDLLGPAHQGGRFQGWLLRSVLERWLWRCSRGRARRRRFRRSLRQVMGVPDPPFTSRPGRGGETIRPAGKLWGNPFSENYKVPGKIRVSRKIHQRQQQLRIRGDSYGTSLEGGGTSAEAGRSLQQAKKTATWPPAHSLQSLMAAVLGPRLLTQNLKQFHWKQKASVQPPSSAAVTLWLGQAMRVCTGSCAGPGVSCPKAASNFSAHHHPPADNPKGHRVSSRGSSGFMLSFQSLGRHWAIETPHKPRM